MRTYAVGDLHGRSDLLSMALDWASRDTGDQPAIFLSLGDMIDRGPDSPGVIRLMRQGTFGSLTLKALQGNHEEMMCAALKHMDKGTIWQWRRNGGEQTIRSYTGDTKSKGNSLWHRRTSQMTDDGRWLANLPVFLEDESRFYVHAGVDYSLPLSEQDPGFMQWVRLIGSEEYPSFRGRHLVHGHEQYASGPILTRNRTNLDTFAWLHGRLTVGVFEDTIPGGPARCHDILGPPDPSMDCWDAVIP